VKIIGIKYDIKLPHRLFCLKVKMPLNYYLKKKKTFKNVDPE
jgi:hypothetical protein